MIGMMAAIFTVTWMQRNNEQLADARRRRQHAPCHPCRCWSRRSWSASCAWRTRNSSCRDSPKSSRKSHDDDGTAAVHVSGRYDARNIYIHGVDADRASQDHSSVLGHDSQAVFGSIRDIKGQQATYIPPDHPTAPLKGGWLVRGAIVNPLLEEELLAPARTVLCHVDNLKGYPRRFTPLIAKAEGQPRAAAKAAASSVEARNDLTRVPHSEYACVAAFPSLPLPVTAAASRAYALLDRKIDIGRGTYFLKTGLDFQAMTRKTNWYQFATTPGLLHGLTDPGTQEGSERTDVAMFVHVRLLRPLLSINLLFMTLPLVLGGYGRNTFINLGFALGNSAMFYGGVILLPVSGQF